MSASTYVHSLMRVIEWEMTILVASASSTISGPDSHPAFAHMSTFRGLISRSISRIAIVSLLLALPGCACLPFLHGSDRPAEATPVVAVATNNGAETQPGTEIPTETTGPAATTPMPAAVTTPMPDSIPETGTVAPDAETEVSAEPAPVPVPVQVSAVSTTPRIYEPAAMAQPYPLDISDQYTRYVGSVPIIENPQPCGTNPLEIRLTVEGISKNRGRIIADLHDDVVENFLVWDKVVLRVMAPVEDRKATFCIPLRQPGEYAIAIYQDLNDNRAFDKNFLGIPKEPFGMSRNPRYGRRAPKYEEVAFHVPADGAEMMIRLRTASDVLLGRHR